MNVLAYGEGEALTGRITADKYAAVAMADILDDCPQVVQELEESAHGVAPASTSHAAQTGVCTDGVRTGGGYGEHV